MAMSEMEKWQKNAESSKRIRQKRKDVKDLCNSGIYDNGYDHYMDEDGNYRDEVAIPQWFKNLAKAWQSNRRLGAHRRKEKLDTIASTKTVSDNWDNWCDERVEMLGEDCDPRIPKVKPGRPKLPDHLKKNPSKVRRSTKMKELLLEHDIKVDDDGSLHSKDGHFIGWKFQVNGRVKFEEEDPISVHKFLTLI